MELILKCCLKRKETSFKDSCSFGELALQSKIVSDVDQRFVMIEIALREVSQGLDVHSLLYHSKLSLKRMILAGLDKAEDFVTRCFVNSHLLHGQDLRINSRPVLLWGAENLSFR